MSSHDLGICMKLKSISRVFDAGKFVELSFVIPECGEIEGGGELLLRINPMDATAYMLGDKYYIHLRSL